MNETALVIKFLYKSTRINDQFDLFDVLITLGLFAKVSNVNIWRFLAFVPIEALRMFDKSAN